jgi:hypothetical protein
MKYLFLSLFFCLALVCHSQSDTTRDECMEAGEIMFLNLCRSCQIQQDSLTVILGYKRVTVYSKVDSLFSSEIDLVNSLSDTIRYLQKAVKVDCPSVIEAINYYDKVKLLYKRELYNLGDKRFMCTTIFTRDEKGRELSSTAYLDTLRGSYSRYKYDKRGNIVESINYSWLFDRCDTVQLKYDRQNRLRSKRAKNWLGNIQTEETTYSKDGMVSVTYLYSSSSSHKHGSLIDSSYYTSSHKISKVLTPQRDIDNLWVVSYQYDAVERLSSLIYYWSTEPGYINDRYVFHYRVDGLLERIEHYTNSRKASISYQYE